MQEIEIDLDKEGRWPFLPTPEGGGFRAEELVNIGTLLSLSMLSRQSTRTRSIQLA